MLAQFDREPIGTMLSTRLLIFGGCERSRLVAWTRAASDAGEATILGLLTGPQSNSWLVLMRQIAHYMLLQTAADPQSSDSLLFLQFINLLSKNRPLSETANVPVAEQIIGYLLARDLYPKLSYCIISFPVQSKSAPQLLELVTLAVAPFRLFSTSHPYYRQSFVGIIINILTIPLLPNRITVPALLTLSSNTPFASFDLVSSSPLFQQIPSDVRRLHLLANLLVFVAPRYASSPASLNNTSLESYLRLLNTILSELPVNALDQWKPKKQQVELAAGEDSDDSTKQFKSQVVESRPSISVPDAKTASRLANLVSQEHITSLLALSEKSIAIWHQIIHLLVNILSKWPGRRDGLLTTIATGPRGPIVFKKLWRDSVRGSHLGKDTGGRSMRDARFVNDWPPLILLVELYTQALLTMSDDEFFASSPAGGTVSRNPLIIGEVTALSRQLLNIVFPLYWTEDTNEIKDGTVPGMTLTWEMVRERITKCLQAIHARDSRRPFTPAGHWLVSDQFDVKSFVAAAIAEEGQLDEGSHPRLLTKRELAYISPRLGILNNIPFSIPFETRVSIFRSFIHNDQVKFDDTFNGSSLFKHRVTIRRDRVSQDGFDHLNDLGPAWKGRLAIQFVDQFGQEEAGIDGGGVFKEFLTSLSKEVFDTDRGLWLATKQQELYPNSHSYAKEPHQLNWYRFIGRVLGKALYEGILVDVAFAGFFLAKWLGKQSYLDDLASLDPELYQGLIFLKNYTGRFEDLSLDFTITENDLGITRTVNLKRNGQNIPVTKENRLEYIILVAYYRLTRQIKMQCDAFFEGLSEIIDPKWLRMFNQQELKILVGGVEEPIDLNDLRENVVYGGLYDDNHPTVRMFWRVCESLDQERRKQLLRFVTSCARPPLLGFKELNPKFAIRDAGIDESRLPTASTCVNLLKLPLYQDEETLRRKLLHAISAGAGFDLS